MTTIVYDGQCRTLYTDSMVTTSGKNVRTRVEATFKVEAFEHLKIKTTQGETILGATFAGSIAHMERALKFILLNMYKWQEGLKQINDNGGTLELGGVSVMLITTKRLYCFTFSYNAVTVNEHELDETITFGSGGAYAACAMEVYGGDGFDAIMAASICDPGTGQLIHAYKLHKDRLEPLEPRVMPDTQANRKAMRRRAGQSKREVKVYSFTAEAPRGVFTNFDEVHPVVKTLKQRHSEAQVAKKAARVKKAST
ncbi:hypothetical protein LUCX_262 [Xanthomonas phage vB_XciM_LucasX]|nr:hypothetical protein LUCX_262 [Xanthomonas phage vB_XciM_LucasX]